MMPKIKQDKNKFKFLEMEIEQLNHTLEDLDQSIKIHKQIVDCLLKEKPAESQRSMYAEIERLTNVNQEI